MADDNNQAPIENIYEPGDFPTNVISEYQMYQGTMGEAVAETYLDNQAKKLNIKPKESRPKGSKAAAAPAPAAAAAPQDNNNDGDNGDGDKNGSIFLKKNKAAAAPTEFKDLTDLTKYAEKNYNTKNINEFLESVNTWRTQASNLGKVEKELGTIKEGIDNLPADLKASIREYSSDPYSDNYRNVWSKPQSRIDYTKPFDNNNFAALLDTYYPEAKDKDFTKTDDPEIKKIKDIIVKQFQVDQKSYLDESNRSKRNRDEAVNKLRSSVDESISSLKKDIPTVTQSHLDGVRSLLRSSDPFASLGIIGKDSIYTDKAAKVLWYAKYGEGEITKLLDIIKEQQAQLETIVSRSSDRPVGTGTTSLNIDTEKQNQDKVLNNILPKAPVNKTGVKYTILK